MAKTKLQHGDSQSRTNASNKTPRDLHNVGGNIPKRRGRPPTKNNKATSSIKITSINQTPIQHDSPVENRTPAPFNQSMSNNQTNPAINNDILLQLAQVRQRIELQQIEHEQMMRR